VAIKLIRQDLGPATPARAALFEREAQTLATLQHPGIATVYALLGPSPSGNHPAALVMEHINGTDLATHVRTQVPLDPRGSFEAERERVRLLTEVAEAIGYAHRMGVVHRDLKPSNVLVRAKHPAPARSAAGDCHDPEHSCGTTAHESGTTSANFAPVVVDFGISKVLGLRRGDDAATGAGILGTVPYVAPEQLGLTPTSTPPAPADQRSDVHALGVMLFELLTGDYPHAGVRDQPLAKAIHAIASGQPRGLCGVRRAIGRASRGAAWRDMEAIVRRATANNPTDRYPDAWALTQDLRRWLDGSPVTARRDTPIQAIGRFVGRHRRMAAVVGAAVTVLAGSTAAIAVLYARSKHAEAETRQAFEDLLAEKRVAERTSTALGRARQSLRRSMNGDGRPSPISIVERAADFARRNFASDPETVSLILLGLSEFEVRGTRWPDLAAQLRRESAELIATLEVSARIVARKAEVAERLVSAGEPALARQVIEPVMPPDDARPIGFNIMLFRVLAEALLAEDRVPDALGRSRIAASMMAALRQAGQPPERPWIAAGLVHAQALERAGEPGAEQTLEHAVADARTLRPNARDLIRSLHELGALRLRLGRPAEAIPALEEALAAFAQAPDEDPPAARESQRLLEQARRALSPTGS
jgi:hypothetical protein